MKEYLQLLGTVQKDLVTGFEGMVSSVSFDAYGCIQVVLTPTKVSEDGEMPKLQWFDANRLVWPMPEHRILDVPARHPEAP